MKQNTRKIIPFLLCIGTLFACQKDAAIRQEPSSSKESTARNGANSPLKATPQVIAGNCNTFYILVPKGDGTYTCNYQTIYFMASGLTYKSRDDNGNPRVPVEGEPALGYIDLDPAHVQSAVLEYSAPYANNQFAAEYGVLGVSGGSDGTAVGIQDYETAFSNWVSVALSGAPTSNNIPPSYMYVYSPAPPSVGDYVKSGSPSWVQVSGKLIMIPSTYTGVNDPVTFAPIYSIYAIAPVCYPVGGPPQPCPICEYCKLHPDDPTCP